MSYGNRHFGKNLATGEEIIIIGYRKTANEILAAFTAGLQQQEAQDLRRIVGSESAQKKDYLMDSIGGSILADAHHPSGTDWQRYLIGLAASGRGSGAVRRLSVKDVEFFDPSQKAFYMGYGPSIEPEIDALRRGRIDAQEAQAAGRAVLPEPTTAEIKAAQDRQAAANATVVVPQDEPAVAASVPDTNMAILQALQDITGRLSALESAPAAAPAPAPAKKPAKKPAAKKRAYNRKPKVDAAPSTADTATATDTDTSVGSE